VEEKWKVIFANMVRLLPETKTPFCFVAANFGFGSKRRRIA